VARFLWASCRVRIEKSQAMELGAQTVWVKPGRLTNNREILLILEEILFCLTFRAERTGNPFLNRGHDHCLPEPHFKSSRCFTQYPCVCSHCSPVCRRSWDRRGSRPL